MQKSDEPPSPADGMMTPMPFRLGPIFPVLLGVVIAQIALGIMTPLIPILLVRGGISTPIIGLVASSYFVGFLCSTMVADRIVRRVGHSRAFAVFAAGATVAALTMSLVTSPAIWALLRFAIGFQASGIFLVAESWLNDKADASTRGRTFGAYMVASWAGAAAGPMALNVVEGSVLLFVVVGIAFAASILPLALTQVRNPALGRRGYLGPIRLYRISPLGVACCLTAGLANSAFYGFAPVYLARLGHDAADVAAFVSITMAVALLGQFPIGILSDRLGRRPVTLAVLTAALLFALLLGVFGGGPLALSIALGSGLAAATAPLYGLGAGQTNDHVDPEEFIGASGGLLLVWALGASVGPSVAAAVMDHTGPSGLFVYLAAVLAAICLFTVARIRNRPGIPRDRQSGFVPGPAAPPRVAELVPRAEHGRDSGPGPGAADTGSNSMRSAVS